MNAYFDIIPIVVFFVVYKFYGIYTATASAIGISFFQMIAYRIMHKRFQMMQVGVFLMIGILGGATIILHKPIFIMWKPTIVNWLLSIVFICSHFIGDKTVAERMMGSTITLDKSIWAKLNISWIFFFILMGFLNLYVVYHYNQDTWNNFKFGMLGITFLFSFVQVIYLSRFIQQEKVEESS